MTDEYGVEGNARMTGVLGAVLLVALAVEGVTVLSVQDMLTLHVFLGLFVIPAVCLKLATTAYRFSHYYRGTAAYRRKGPPHPVLRIAAPVVVIATIALLGSGVVTLAVGPRHSDTWLTIHQASFVVWFVVTTIHVLGHISETWKLTTAEMRARPTCATTRDSDRPGGRQPGPWSDAGHRLARLDERLDEPTASPR